MSEFNQVTNKLARQIYEAINKKLTTRQKTSLVKFSKAIIENKMSSKGLDEIASIQNLKDTFGIECDSCMGLVTILHRETNQLLTF